MKKINSKSLYRSVDLSREHIDEENRTVELAFSSEEPVSRWFGEEILDHAPESVRLGRMNDGGAVLVDHDPTDHIGVVESVSIDADRRGRAVVRFGNSTRASEIFQDVKDGIRKHVSVGYRIHKMIREEASEDVDIMRATDWEPFEISIVAVPADASVGVGRADDSTNQIIIEDRKMPEEKKVEQVEKPAIDVSAEREEARKVELDRVREILAVGETYGVGELAREHAAKGTDVNEFNKVVLDTMRTEHKPVEDAEIGLNEKEVRNFSFVRAIHALANPADKRAQDAAAFEIECSAAAAERAGKTPRGLLVPADVLNRDLSVGTATAGGHTVSTDLLSGSFIELLRNAMAVNQMGATYLTDLVGNIAIPRQTGGASAYWVAESGAPTESQQAFDQVAMSPNTVGAFTDYSRKLMLQSAIGIENFIRGDLARILALEIDRAALYGSGASNQPEGIANVTGINTSTFAAADPTFAEVVGLETLVAADNADIGNLGYLTDGAMRGAFKTTEKASNTGQFVWEGGNTVNGYGCGISNQVVDGDVFFGNWADLLIGMWGGLDLTVDPYSNSTSGTVRIVALQDVDVAVRHPESFALGNDGI